jgi:hypothetical protein
LRKRFTQRPANINVIVSRAKRTCAEATQDGESEIAGFSSNKKPRSLNNPVDDGPDDLHIAESPPRVARPRKASSSFTTTSHYKIEAANSSVQRVQRDVNRSSSPATIGHTQNIDSRNLPTDEEQCLQRLPANILKLQTNFKEAEAAYVKAYGLFQEATDTVNQANARLRDFSFEASIELSDILGCYSNGNRELTPVTIQEMANSVLELGNSKKIALLSMLEEPVTKKTAAEIESKETKVGFDKHRKNMDKLMKIAQILDED